MLQALGRLVGTNEDLLVYITISKLDQQTQRELFIGKLLELPKYEDLYEFLNIRLKVLKNLAGLQARSAPMTIKTRLSVKVKAYVATGQPRSSKDKKKVKSTSHSLYAPVPTVNRVIT